ncbi:MULTISPECIES: hypothetical protein [Vibrio]|uniref:Uncharacterized protein n=2 Tax=Vibrio TaxID=662 RepID=A0A7X4LPI8_9VIBR|nr:MULTISPECIES: hypothetical protein [Vibrio]MBF9002935.1 hypothetical protein [Vibrio nitrifigilis]MZI95774.1 hypothetical protein [Vibrio eleionomae]
MEQTIILNLPYDLSEQDNEKVTAVYSEMDGWQAKTDFPCWFGTPNDAQYITVSSKPSGLVVIGKVNGLIWMGWITKLCAKLSIALNREIYDAESEKAKPRRR